MISEFVEGNGSVDNRNPEGDGNVEEELDRSLGDVDLPSDIQDGSFSDDLGLYSGSAASRFNIDDPELDGRSANCHIIMACVNPLLASRPVSCCCELHTGGSPTCVPFFRLRRTALFGRFLRFLLSCAAGGNESQCQAFPIPSGFLGGGRA